jgi:hypothetical protein
MVEKIISGCQTGADEAGLRVGKVLGLATGGFMPAGFRTEAGPRPDLAEFYDLECTKSSTYPPRTRSNVRASDATIIFGRQSSPGCRLTARYCSENEKPCLRIADLKDAPEAVRLIREFVAEHNPTVLNIAGNREESSPGIGDSVFRILSTALS